jgi:hypothetical protein
MTAKKFFYCIQLDAIFVKVVTIWWAVAIDFRFACDAKDKFVYDVTRPAHPPNIPPPANVFPFANVVSIKTSINKWTTTKTINCAS